ncbi:arginase family protein [Rhizobium rhizogenes]|uniref:arginase family protein n=1 Tax=Rhizobium rhizogenes TaxID=359 RepID=UPI001F1C4BAE|nr:arginase family protein [Rhizobium rhizogenes]WEO69929.1 hypothetical protein G6L54_032925 [Rhizobium rhizogenes]
MLLQMLHAPVHRRNVSMMGIRSVDPEERPRVAEIGIEVVDMLVLDEQGAVRPLEAFFNRVNKTNGRLCDLDERRRTARLMTDLAASLFGRPVSDRVTIAF